MLCLQKVQEGEVGGRARHQGRLLALEFLQHDDGLVEILALQEVGGLGDLHLRADAREAVVVQRVDDPIVARHGGLVHQRRDQVRRIDDEAGGLALSSLDVLPQGIITLGDVAVSVLQMGWRLQLHLLLVEVLQADLLNVEQLEETCLHFLLVTQGVVAEHQVKACHEIQVLATVREQILVRVDGIRKLVHLEERVADVPHDLETDRLNIIGDLVQGHSVHLDRCGPLLLLEVDVAHVYAKSAAEWVLLVLHDLSVDRQGLGIVIVGLMLDRQVQAHRIRQVDVQLV
mmetsp:Transcript_157410/g.504924  ORF Transcript_157410/g.504924 Transcript_157410/m.504924 type:complete len:287 (-) Transcript_157410:576-1436(-)